MAGYPDPAPGPRPDWLDDGADHPRAGRAVDTMSTIARDVDAEFLDIITREEWGAPANTAARVDLPYTEVVLHTEAGAVLPGDWDTLTDLATVLSLTEREHVRAIDRYHRVTRGWKDGIGYSFLIERDGTIIEGRGWGRLGVHTQQGRNRTAVGICFAGHGDLQAATGAQWAAARRLIAWGIRIGALVRNYALSGHRRYAAKSCPGNLVFPHLSRLAGVAPDTPTPQEDALMAVTDAQWKALTDQVNAIAVTVTALKQEVIDPVNKATGETRLDRVAKWGARLAVIEDRLDDLANRIPKG